MTREQIQGVIFDLDGTLLDSNAAHARAWVEAMTEKGYKVSFEQIFQLIGMGGDKLLPTAIKVENDSEEGRQLSKRRSEIFKEKYLATLKPFPDTANLLQRLQDSGLKLMLATSAQSDELEDLLKLAGVTRFFQETTSSGDAKNSKPDPDIIQVALGKLGYEANKAVMIGDTPYDVQAAKLAGVSTIALRCGGWQDADLKDAIAIYNDPQDLLNNLDASPFSQNIQNSKH